MARNDGIDRTVARNRDLKKSDTIKGAQAHNERQKEIYSNPDIVPERTPFNIHFKEPTGSYEDMFKELEQQKVISTWGQKPDSTKFCELIFDVNSAYFYNNGGYEFAKQFYADAYEAAVKIVGGEQFILSAVMHADERNRAMSEALGEDIYHYHLHVVYVPVVEKQILWSKRCKDPALIGTVKETIMQVSRSKKWDSKQAVDDYGEPMLTPSGKKLLKKSYSVLQDDFYEHMIGAGYTDLQRGERGSTEEHLTVTQFKVEQEKQRLADISAAKVEALDDLEKLAEEEKQKQDSIAQLNEQADAAQARVNEIVSKVKNLEEQARKYAYDEEERLPQPDVLETAKAYREHKAKPAMRKFQKVYLAIYEAYQDLKRAYNNLKKELERALGRVATLEATVDHMIEENAEKSVTVEKYDTLCRSYGKDYIEGRVREIWNEEELQKQQRKLAHKSPDRDAR